MINFPEKVKRRTSRVEARHFSNNPDQPCRVRKAKKWETPAKFVFSIFGPKNTISIFLTDKEEHGVKWGRLLEVQADYSHADWNLLLNAAFPKLLEVMVKLGMAEANPPITLH